MTKTWKKGDLVKSFRNCAGTVFTVVTAHRDGMLTVRAVPRGEKYRVTSDLFYAAYLPDRFIPLHLPLPSGQA